MLGYLGVITHTHTHTHIYIYIYIYIYITFSVFIVFRPRLIRYLFVANAKIYFIVIIITDSLDSHSTSALQGHHFWLFLLTVSGFSTYLMRIYCCWASPSGMSLFRSPQKNVSYEFFLVC